MNPFLSWIKLVLLLPFMRNSFFIHKKTSGGLIMLDERMLLRSCILARMRFFISVLYIYDKLIMTEKDRLMLDRDY